MNCYFWNFPLDVFRPQLTAGTETADRETADKGGPQHCHEPRQGEHAKRGGASCTGQQPRGSCASPLRPDKGHSQGNAD